MIEPHAYLLQKPEESALLYKVIKSKYFFDMLNKGYLYFKRVDTYHDDTSDGDQPENDKVITGTIGFEKNPDYTATQYYSDSRSKTYACCFSTKNTAHLWEYYSGGDKNAICLVLDCCALIQYLNSVYATAPLIVGDEQCENFFNINYGLVNYVDRNQQFIQKELPNPIEYAYLKDTNKYSDEHEFRITLSCIGMKKY